MPIKADEAVSLQRRWWRRPATWLACIEIACGLSLGFGGCFASLASDASLAGVGAAFALCVGILTLALPGALLLGRHPLRWIGQLLPAALLVGLLLTWSGAR